MVLGVGRVSGSKHDCGHTCSMADIVKDTSLYEICSCRRVLSVYDTVDEAIRCVCGVGGSETPFVDWALRLHLDIGCTSVEHVVTSPIDLLLTLRHILTIIRHYHKHDLRDDLTISRPMLPAVHAQ